MKEKGEQKSKKTNLMRSGLQENKDINQPNMAEIKDNQNS